MNKVILLRFGELYLKGNNRGYFEKTLISNIKKILELYNASIKNINGRYLVFNYSTEKENLLVEDLTKVFGLVSLSRAKEIDTNEQEIKSLCNSLEFSQNTFRVSVTRADKKFPILSSEFAKILGGEVLNKNPNITVDLTNPEVTVMVDIRDNGKTYISTEKIECVGGMPVSTAGKGLLLLSGGIDSPVAGYMMAKRGMNIDALHFHSFPYTSLQAKQKVIKLRDLIEKYCGKIKLHICSFTEIQEEIHKHCAPEYMIAIMRRIMMRIAEKVCFRNDYKAIITGESLGQVASQTVESITSSNSVLKQKVVLRPLIAFDKTEITDISNKINTYETSILPYEDCCTIFLPKNPIIHPKLENVLKEESKLNIDLLIENAIKSIEII